MAETFQKLMEDHQPQPTVENHDTLAESKTSVVMTKQQLWLNVVGGMNKSLVFGLDFEVHISKPDYGGSHRPTGDYDGHDEGDVG
ncbi:UNVERIFIED_CONTAM: hypothetical protein Sradi_4097400 [Sesamum radiatum]|uniref:Uncharacterized protein n=1 Tax=Sesamum radiatum TaxID=300843 RepID=A0AAW2P2X6_SESRA